MNCDRAQTFLSARLDGERLSPRVAAGVDAHVAGCPDCAAFVAGSERVRTAVRIRPAERVPDLVDPIMRRIAAEPRRTWSGKRGPGRPGRDRRVARVRGRRGSLAPIAAALAVGLVAGSIVVGGPWQGGERAPLAAAAVVRDVRGQAAALTSYQASFSIVEHGLSPDVPDRELEMSVSYLAPQRFRLDMRDLTTYPSSSWTPTDLTFIQDAGVTYRSGPTGCPATLSPGTCPATRATVMRRGASGAATSPAAELILPLATFDSPAGVAVLGEERVDGRDAIRVRLSFARASPLFPFLDLGGTWRPFFDRDRVDVWLDAHDWSPLRWRITASGVDDRRAWELRFGRPEEAPGTPLMDVRATAIDRTPPAPATFAIPGGAVSDEVPLSELRGELGYLPATPTAPGALRLTSSIAPVAGDTGPRSLLVYTEGLAYVRIGERPDWAGPGLFGPVDATAERVPVGDGVAYYEPAEVGVGRRLALHTEGTNLYLESNLPRARLLDLAATLPVRGEAVPLPWHVRSGIGSRLERIEPAEILVRAPFAAPLPATLPDGYVAASAQLESMDGDVKAVTIVYRQRESDLAGGPLVLHVEPGLSLPPASSTDQFRVDAAGSEVRWTPGRQLLEWERDGVYRSLGGPLSLEALLRILSAMTRGQT